MPTYSFRCRKCGQDVVVAHAFDEAHPDFHEGCGGELERRFSKPNIHYRGSGFFTNDKKLTPVDPLDYNPEFD